MVFATWLLFIALAVTGFMLEIDALFGNSLLQDIMPWRLILCMPSPLPILLQLSWSAGGGASR